SSTKSPAVDANSSLKNLQDMTQFDERESDSQWLRRLAAGTDPEAESEGREGEDLPQLGVKGDAGREKSGGEEVAADASDLTAAADEAAAAAAETDDDRESEDDESRILMVVKTASIVEVKPGKRFKQEPPEQDEDWRPKKARLIASLEQIMDMKDDISNFIRSEFDLILKLTTIETPADTWKELLEEYATSEEEVEEGSQLVDDEHPSGKESEEDKELGHRKLARKLVTRMVEAAMKDLVASRAPK
ncbi:hypothetical protein PFISCL1PPCAC_22670, partial [Pristionchus fissidentatus]